MGLERTRDSDGSPLIVGSIYQCKCRGHSFGVENLNSGIGAFDLRYRESYTLQSYEARKLRKITPTDLWDTEEQVNYMIFVDTKTSNNSH